MERRSTGTLRQRLMRRVALPIFAVILAIGGTAVYLQTERAVEADAMELEGIAATAALGIPGDELDQLRVHGDHRADGVRTWLRKVKDANHLSTDIHALRRHPDGRITIIVSSATPLRTGTPHDGPPEIEEVFRTGTSKSTLLYSDGTGEWLSGYAPIRNARGDLVGVLAVDRAAADIRLRNIGAVGLSAILFLAGTLCLLLIFRRLEGSVAEPVNRLAKAVRRVGRGEFDVEGLCDVRTNDELCELGEGILSMARAVAQREDEHQHFEQSLQQNSALRQKILSCVNHELRTPVTLLAAYSELLMSTNVSDEERAEFCSTIHAASLRLGRLVDQALRVAQYSGEVDAEDRQPMELRKMVDAAADEVRDEARSRCIQIHIKVDPGLQAVGEPNRLTCALVCLLGNAVQYGPHGSTVTVHGGSDNDVVWLNVQDRGTGVPATAQPHIFEMFAQGGDILTDKPEGMGLGLPLTRLCMHAIGGRATLRSTTSEGSVFRLEMESTPAREDCETPTDPLLARAP